MFCREADTFLILSGSNACAFSYKEGSIKVVKIVHYISFIPLS